MAKIFWKHRVPVSSLPRLFSIPELVASSRPALLPRIMWTLRRSYSGSTDVVRCLSNRLACLMKEFSIFSSSCSRAFSVMMARS